MVLPGNYTVTIHIPNVSRTLRGQLTVTGDAEDKMSAADRASRQASLMQLYDLQKRLAAARAVQSSTPAAEQERVSAELDRLIGIAGGLMRAIESFNAPPTADQRRQIAWAQEDAARALAASLGRK